MKRAPVLEGPGLRGLSAGVVRSSGHLFLDLPLVDRPPLLRLPEDLAGVDLLPEDLLRLVELLPERVGDDRESPLVDLRLVVVDFLVGVALSVLFFTALVLAEVPERPVDVFDLPLSDRPVAGVLLAGDVLLMTGRLASAARRMSRLVLLDTERALLSREIVLLLAERLASIASAASRERRALMPVR